MKTSKSILNICKALIEFQGKMVKVTKDAVNPHFKNRYASLSQIIESIQKPLNESGLAVIQLPTMDNALSTITQFNLTKTQIDIFARKALEEIDYICG